MGQMGMILKLFNALPEAISEIRATPPQIVVLNSGAPRAADGLLAIHETIPSAEVIVLADVGNPDEAETSVKNGAWDYIVRPSKARDIIPVLTRMVQYVEEKHKDEPPGGIVEGNFEGIVGNSLQMRKCLDIVSRFASSDTNVLVKGETGTGKELIAWAIHRNSPRRNSNFVVVDCAGLPENLVESTLFGHERGAYTGADKSQVGLVKQADGGTLFLDEIGELPLSIQKSFLRVLHERKFRPVGGKQEISSDFRLISATNRNLEEMVQEMEFREDLLFRIRSFTIELPRLRDRLDDIKDIVTYHLPRICDRMAIRMKRPSPEFLDALLGYDWPGNVRELVSALERSIIAARFEPSLFPQHLPTYLRVRLARAAFENPTASAERSERIDQTNTLPTLQVYRGSANAKVEKEYLRHLLAVTNTNIQEACRISGLSRSRFYALLKKNTISLRAKFEK
jgi:two-component system, NtrC family, response regulator